MILNARAIINTGTFQHLEFDVEIEVPSGLKNRALIEYLHREYWGCLTPEALGHSNYKSTSPTHNQTSVSQMKNPKAARVVAVKEGVDVDNLHYEGDGYQKGEKVDWEKIN